MREDKRQQDQLRPLEIKMNASKYAEGSCLIQMGNTHVLCNVSIEEKVPGWMRGKGRGWVTAEYSMLPRSCQQRIPRDISKGKLNGRSQEIQRLIGRSMRSVVDLDALGERTLWVDCDVLQGDGGTRCASITGAYIALQQACDVLVSKKKIKKSPILDQVAAISVGMVKDEPTLDLCYTEDSTAEVDMNVVMTGSGDFVEIQGTAEQKPFSEAVMQSMTTLAKKGIKELLQAQKEALEGCAA